VKFNDFDRIAFVYDLLAKLVFGGDIINSQRFFLNRIEGSSKVLILGGGSGQLLAELVKAKPSCEVWYIEASQKMISLSEKKLKKEFNIHFIHGTEQDIPSSKKYDILITNFYLDLFIHHQLTNIIIKLQSSMKPGALWIVTDFVKEKRWQVIMLKVMYWFFRITCNIESRQLPEWSKSVEQAGMKEVDSKTFYSGFIKTVLYQF